MSHFVEFEKKLCTHEITEEVFKIIENHQSQFCDISVTLKHLSGSKAKDDKARLMEVISQCEEEFQFVNSQKEMLEKFKRLCESPGDGKGNRLLVKLYIELHQPESVDKVLINCKL